MADDTTLPLLPLPCWAKERLRNFGLSRGTRQRISRRRFTQSSANEVVLALNSLAGCDKPSLVAPSVAQQRSLDRIQVVLHEFANAAPLNKESLDEARRALLGTDRGYASAADGTKGVVTFDDSRVSVPSAGSTPVKPVRGLPEFGRKNLVHFETELLLDEDDLDDVINRSPAVSSYMDIKLARCERLE